MPDPQPAPSAGVVAVIDIGSNSVRMVIAQVRPDGSVEVLERMQRPVRLGHSSFLNGRLSQQTINAAIAILRDYRRIIDSYHVRKVRAVATSAVREAANSDSFVDRAAIAADIDIEIIEGAEESRLTVSAVREDLKGVFDINKGPALIVEIGGGSGLVTVLENGVIASSESYNLGSIRLQELLGTSQEPPERAVDLLRHHIDNVVAVMRRTMPIQGVDHFVAIGGDARFAAQQIGKPANDLAGKPSNGAADVFLVTARKFNNFVRECSLHSAEELARTYGLPFANAETVVPALLAYQALLQASRGKQMIVSSVSMRDGLLLDMARYVTGREDPALAESIIQSAEAVGERYRYDEKHAHQVSALAVRLFDELKPEHRLAPRYRLLLQVAGLLHEIGGYVSSRAHHKHSGYLIANSSIFGMRRDEIEICAQVARYHRRSPPRPSHREYLMLTREQRVVVSKLAAILRVADALDRGHAQQVTDFVIERRADELLVYISGATDLSLERRAIARKGDLFEEAYGLRVNVEEDRR